MFYTQARISNATETTCQRILGTTLEPTSKDFVGPLDFMLVLRHMEQPSNYRFFYISGFTQIVFKLVVILMIHSYKNSYIFRYDVNLKDHDGNDCEWKGDKTGFVVQGTDKPCVKSIGYYQWIPYVLLLQVRR